MCVYECVSYLISFSPLFFLVSMSMKMRTGEREREREKYRGRVYVDENNNNQLRAMTSKLAFFICLLLSYYHDDNEVTARWEYPEETQNLCSVLSGDVRSSDQLLQKEAERRQRERKGSFLTRTACHTRPLPSSICLSFPSRDFESDTHPQPVCILR